MLADPLSPGMLEAPAAAVVAAELVGLLRGLDEVMVTCAKLTLVMEARKK